MGLLDMVATALGALFGLSFVMYFLAHLMTGLRLKREHPELWESLGRPVLFSASKDPESKAANYKFFWNKGYLAVHDQTFQTYARRAHVLGLTTLVLLAVLTALFLYKNLFQ